jgi:hypothetical protein
VDDLDSKDFDTQDFGTEDLDEMIVYGEGSAITQPENKPIPFDDDDTVGARVSHAPLNLGGGATTGGAATGGGTASISKPSAAVKGEQKLVSSARITGIRTFFTKLHPGAIDFLDEQICNWLKDNPGITVKRTNMTTGEVQGKKTEANIIISVWY